MKVNIRIFHEYGAPRHFLALNNILTRVQGEIEQVTFDPVILAYTSLRTFKMNHFVYNIVSLLKCMILPDYRDTVNIVGLAPLHYFVYYFLNLLKRGKRLIYFTSWPYWDFSNRKNQWVYSIPDLRKPWRSFIEKVNAIVCVTNASFDALTNYSQNVFCIPHSVDTGLFRPCEFKKDNNTIRVLYVGRLVKEKGIKYLIEVICKTKWEQNVEFWFVGDGPLRSLIKSLERKYPIKYFGYISNQNTLVKIYQNSDILVLPTVLEELFGIVLIEAMACGLPTIATDTLGPREIIKNGETGFIIPKRDVNALKDSIMMLIHDRNLRMRMGVKARAEAVKKYDVSVVSNKWLKVIKEVLP